MRVTAAFAAVLALALAACGEVRVEADNGAGASVNLSDDKGDFALNVISGPDSKTFLVIRPDGMQVAAIADKEGSRLIDAGTAHAAASEAVASIAPGPDKVAIEAPGLKIKVQGDDAEGEPARVAINIAGREINVDSAGSDEAGAVVRIAGVDEKSARDFIDKAEGLSPEVKAQMKEKLGL